MQLEPTLYAAQLMFAYHSGLKIDNWTKNIVCTWQFLALLICRDKNPEFVA